MKIIKLIFVLTAILSLEKTYAQTCDCEAEFKHVKDLMEQNYAGFKDKQALMTKAGYEKLVNEFLQYSKLPHSNEECIFILSQFLDNFKDNHVSVRSNLGGKTDSAFIKQRQIIEISDEKYKELLKSKSKEGIYYFNWDTAAYKIAVIKDKTPIHDYIGVIVSSNLPGWKKGMLKLDAKMVNDSVAKGVLYMRNQMPAVNGFMFKGNTIYGDWQRVGTVREKQQPANYVPVASKKLDDKTLYIKISNFGTSNAKNIDSVFKVNEEALKNMPYLVLDLRNNGGGADYTYEPILPYVYTNPVRSIGVDVFATETNIAGWKKYLEDKDMPDENKKSISGTIEQMEANKGKWVNIADDYVDSARKPLHYPSKVVILIDKGCASTTEQFLLYARQSSKVILAGENTSGTLDYSNVVAAPFVCMPYVLQYSSSKSRRLNINQGIDNIGIKPDKQLDPKDDWLKAAVSILEK
jgi:hypothetical protein